MAPEARAAAAAATGWWWWWWIAAPELVLLSQRIEDMLVVVVAVVLVVVLVFLVVVLVFRFYSMERKPFRVPSPKLSPAHTAVRLQKKRKKKKRKKRIGRSRLAGPMSNQGAPCVRNLGSQSIDESLDGPINSIRFVRSVFFLRRFL